VPGNPGPNIDVAQLSLPSGSFYVSVATEVEDATSSSGLGPIDVFCFLDGANHQAENFVTAAGPLSLAGTASGGTITLVCHNGLIAGGFEDGASLDNVHLDAIQVGALH
jgi:hypothetical protein